MSKARLSNTWRESCRARSAKGAMSGTKRNAINAPDVSWSKGIATEWTARTLRSGVLPWYGVPTSRTGWKSGLWTCRELRHGVLTCSDSPTARGRLTSAKPAAPVLKVDPWPNTGSKLAWPCKPRKNVLTLQRKGDHIRCGLLRKGNYQMYGRLSPFLIKFPVPVVEQERPPIFPKKNYTNHTMT